ncbi:uncharacterized protein [Montipora foliosa]|uniref:uncharacterized protein isoform X2 n=1 Tax=Montipora foliosa TaxID=591990 RepID=UPI0035F179F7
MALFKRKAREEEKESKQQTASSLCQSDIIESIRQLYKTCEGVVYPFPWCEGFSFQLENIFTRLKIVAKEKTHGTLTKEITNMTSIFTSHEECQDSRIVLIEGEPGMGKTTYCQKLAYDWATKQDHQWDESFPRVEVLLLLRCRDIDSSIWEAIDDQILPEGIDPELKETFFRFVLENPAKVLLVLDGLDEADPQKLAVYFSLVQRKLLPGCHIVLTSRHEAGNKVRPFPDTLLEIVGFTSSDAKGFIRKYFRPAGQMAEKLIEVLWHQRIEGNLEELTKNPLYTSLLCVLFEDFGGVLPSNTTQLYLEIVLLVLIRYETKYRLPRSGEDLLIVYKKELMTLGKMAQESLFKGEGHFEDVEGNFKKSPIIKFGFLSIQAGGSKRRPCFRYSFIHKTFQEFFSGLYLAFSILDGVIDKKSVLTDKRFFGQLRQVFIFMNEIIALNSGDTCTGDPEDGRSSDSSVPLEIQARGSKAVYAFQKAMQTGEVKVYRGRIMLLGQARAGKTSLKKSLLGLPFDPSQKSTVGVEVDSSTCEIEVKDPSTCKIEVDHVINWTPSERKKLEESEFGEEIARLIAKDLAQTEADKKNETAAVSQLDQVQTSSRGEKVEDQENLELPSNEAELWSYMDQKSEIAVEVGKSKDEGPVEKSNELELNIDITTMPSNVTDLVVRYLQDLRLEDEIKTKEVILSLWDFAGQHVYYAAHSVFLSQRAVYVLVYNLNKNLLAEAEHCCRQGTTEILLDNFNNESNLDNLLSWLVSVHSIRSVAVDSYKNLENENKLRYLRPPVIIAGTHADQPFEDVKTTEKRIKGSILGKEYAKHVITTYFAVNNAAENDEGVEKLRQKIMEVLNNEPYMGEEVPLRWFHFEKVVEKLVAKSMYHMDLDQLLPVIKQVCRIDDEDEATAMLNFYHDLGVIVKHGRTVVLQAQWLIDLFKQLITVRPYKDADPLYVNCWEELEDKGILRTPLVDHVFSDLIKKGHLKQDILEMMELYGLIAKFSSGMPTSENKEEPVYFVPAQLRSSPSELCEIKPSERDPCPLFVHFLDGFVPHGLFPQFVSRCISWCSESGFKETPKLFNNGARFLLGKQIILALICRKRFIKVVLKRRQCPLEPSSSNASNEMAVEVRTFIERTLDGFSQDLPWLSNLRYELSVACTHCLQSGHMFSQHRSRRFGQDDSLHLLKVLPCGEVVSCVENFSDEMVTAPGVEKWFELQYSQNEEREMDMSSEAVGTPSPSPFLVIAPCIVRFGLTFSM